MGGHPKIEHRIDVSDKKLNRLLRAEYFQSVRCFLSYVNVRIYQPSIRHYARISVLRRKIMTIMRSLNLILVANIFKPFATLHLSQT